MIAPRNDLPDILSDERLGEEVARKKTSQPRAELLLRGPKEDLERVDALIEKHYVRRGVRLNKTQMVLMLIKIGADEFDREHAQWEAEDRKRRQVESPPPKK